MIIGYLKPVISCKLLPFAPVVRLALVFWTPCMTIQDDTRLCRTIQNYIGGYRTIYDYIGVYVTKQNYMGLYKTIQDYAGLYRIK